MSMFSIEKEIKLLEKKAEIERKAHELPIPIERVANLQNAIRPVLENDVLMQVEAGMASTRHLDTWREWGFKQNNSVLLLSGPPGTGKTITARWMAKRLKKCLITIATADFGSVNFGEPSRNIRRIFTEGKKEKAIIFLDECDSLLWDRGKATGDSMWMIAIVNDFLQEIEKYEGIIILSTNHKRVLDRALQRRITFEIEFKPPTYQARKAIWKTKWPTWPLELNEEEIKSMALADLTGAEIETIIEREARFALHQERKPNYKSLRLLVEQESSRTKSTTQED